MTISYNDGTPAVTFCYDGDTTDTTGSSNPADPKRSCVGAPSATSQGANLKGKLTQVKSSASATSYPQYDQLGRVTASVQNTPYGSGNPSYPFSYGHDLSGNLTWIQYPSGRIVSYDYNPAGHPNTVWNGLPNTTAYASSFSFTPHGALTGLTLHNGLVESIQYTSRLTPSSQSATKSGTSLLSLGYTYYQNSNAKTQSITASNGTSSLSWNQSFTYDTLSRLSTAAETGSDSWSETFGYDTNNNRWVNTSGQAPYNPLFSQNQNVFSPLTNRINRYVDMYNNSTAVNWYDTAGNQTQVGPAGTAGTFQATYDAEGRQTKVTDASNTVTAYAYDGIGQRVQRGSTIYVYDVAGNLAAEYTTTLPSTQPCSTCYVSPDALGSARLVTNDGSFVSRHDFAAFGEELFTTNRTNAMSYGITDSMTHLYTGKERDSETGLDFFGARYRSSYAGRFTTRDPGSLGASWSSPQTWNGYSYVHNNPTSWIDPSGMIALQPSAPPVSFQTNLPSMMFGWGGDFFDFSSWLIFQAEVTALKNRAATLENTGKRVWTQNPAAKPAQTQRPTNGRCANGANGIGFGWVAGASGALGFGPNGGYGVSGAASVGGGTFLGGGQKTEGTFGSAGFAGTDKGSLANYPPNSNGPRNLTYGGFGGAGAGLFVTNAGNSTTLQGPFTSYLLSIGIWGFEFDYSNGTWVASLTVAKSAGLGVTRLQTNTFSTDCR